MQVVLVMFKADGARRTFPLSRDVTIIGRREDCDLRIPLTEISRKHCRVIKSGNGLRLEDLGSSNGTYHNGNRISEADVAPGDHIRIGPVTFTVQIDGVPADDLITPPMDEQASSAGAQLESMDSGTEATGVSRVPSPFSPAALAGRPLTPEGDDFTVAADEDDDDEVIDLHPISPQDDDQKSGR